MKDLEIILKNIKNKEFSPIYFFHGKEPYYTDLIVKELEQKKKKNLTKLSFMVRIPI